MLRITIDDLDELRLKLLSAIATGAVEGDVAKFCLICAKDLDGLAVLLGESGESAICPPADKLANLLQSSIEQTPIAGLNR